MSSGCATVRGDQVRPNFEFRRLLVLSDFSRGAKSALNCAQAIARKFQSKIFLLHLIPSGVFQFVSSDSGTEALLRAKEFAEQQMNVLLDELKTLGLVEAGIVVKGQL